MRIISWCLRKSDKNFPLKCLKKNIFTTKFQDIIMCCKKIDNVYEPFIGLKYINSIAEIIPNFMYTFQVHDNLMYSEYIEGITLLDYIVSDQYNIKEFISILLQVALALDMTSDMKFVHYDLFPWKYYIAKA